MSGEGKKVLLVATVVKKHINAFHIPTLKMLKEMGYTTYVAARNDFDENERCEIPYCDHYIDIPFERNPLERSNFSAYRKLKELIDKEGFDIIHCHTPVGAMCGRLAARSARKHGTRVFYTAHGFHFYKGAPLKNWLLYYPVEKLCAHFTDVLITINQEDYSLAQKKMKAKKVVYVPGVGIDLERFSHIDVDKTAKRKELGIPQDAIVILSVGEVNENKNHQVIIRAIARIKDERLHYIIAGQGDNESNLRKLANELGIGVRVHLLGFRKDVQELCSVSDVFAFPSYREGLSVALMEAMACGLPVVCSRIRGNTDLIDENGGGTFAPNCVDECRNAIDEILQKDIKSLGEHNAKKITIYSLDNVMTQMHNIYSE